MPYQLYKYVGPPEILNATKSSPSGAPIRSIEDLSRWLDENTEETDGDGSFTATFVVDESGDLLLAPRRSEHVACAAGGPVLSAGEITFSVDGSVSGISNQSTGFCPEPDSWPPIASALNRIPVSHPDDFTLKIVFRLCPKCNNRNIVKDAWFACEICGAELPSEWNFDSRN